MARGKTVTNAGMVASENEMLGFVKYLNQLAKGLTDKMNAAKNAVDKMHEAGYNDATYNEYRSLFMDEVEFINEMNKVLDSSGKHYEKMAEFVHCHNEHIMKSKYGSKLKI